MDRPCCLAPLLCLVTLYGPGCGGQDSNPPAGNPDAGATVDLTIAVYHRAPGRAEPAFGWDQKSNRVVSFGGDDGMAVATQLVPSYHDDTWIFDVAAAAWSQSKATGPGPRGRPAFAMDTKARRLIMTGGRYRPVSAGTKASVSYTVLTDTWAYDVAGDTWSELKTNVAAPARSGAVAVFDAARDRVVMFGGNIATSFVLDLGNITDYTQPQNDTWELVGGKSWAKVATKGALPTKRYLTAAALDTKRNRMVVVGGCCDNMGGFFSDAWALDLGSDTWSKIADGGAGPANRLGHGAAYDAVNDRVVVFGGHDDGVLGNVNDVWALEGDGTWNSLNPGDIPENPVLGCAGNKTEQPYDFVVPIPQNPERRERQIFLSIGDRILVSGGEGDCAQLDDTFTLQQGGFTRLIPAIHGESCLRRGDQCACLCQ